MAKKIFLVEVEIPYGCTHKDVGDYIKEAVQGWQGGFDQSNPLTDLDKDKVQVYWISKEIMRNINPDNL